jgi:hypothetical protein
MSTTVSRCSHLDEHSISPGNAQDAYAEAAAELHTDVAAQREPQGAIV